MNDDEKRAWQKAMRKIDSRMKFRVDEALTDFRNWWDQWSAEDRSAFKLWVNKLTALQGAMPSVAPNLHLRLEFSEQVGEDEYNVFTPPIPALKLAIECWERGEPYTPKSLGELCG